MSNYYSISMRNAWRSSSAVTGLGLGLAQSANAQTAQFPQFNTMLQNIVAVLSSAGVPVVAVAIAWAGYKMVFQHARFADVATVVLGAMLIGASASIAQWLIG